jgi:osmotically-inducible protein OsmY
MKTMLTGVAIALAAAALPTFAQELGPAVRESASDVLVQDAVQSRIQRDHRLDGSLLTVSVHDGHVSVTGTLKDESQETEVYRVARQVGGVTDVFVFAQPDLE